VAARIGRELPARTSTPVPAEVPSGYALRLFVAFTLDHDGVEVMVKSREQRVIALLALEGCRTRSYLAGMLWPEATECRASGSLRAAVWQLERCAPGLVHHGGGQLGLAQEVRVDVRQFVAAATEVSLLTGDPDIDGPARPMLTRLATLLRGELLPGWYDDWMIYERTRLQQLRLSALENLAEALADHGLLGPALTAAMAAAAIEPLRESAQRAVIRIHLADGNYHAALREYRTFGRRLHAELGVRPSGRLEALVRPLLDRQAAARGRAATELRPVSYLPAVRAVS
jgi:DNA-binding SARP family transcriptional activator